MTFDGLFPSVHHLISQHGGYNVVGIDPQLSFDISSLGLSGRSAGLLTFDFKCIGGNGQPNMHVFWWGGNEGQPTEARSLRFTADDGPLIIPMDASPRWLLTNQIKGVRIDLDNASACEKINVTNLALYQRKWAQD